MNYTPELELLQYDPVEDAELFFNIEDGMNANWTKVDDAIKDMRTRLRAPVADLAALKAIDTTNIVDRALCFCAALGMYRFDKNSAAAGNDDMIVTPTTGGGRWLLMIGSDGKSLDARKLNGQAPSYYAKDSDVQALLTSLDGGVTNTPTIGIGMNRINHTGEVAVYPEINFSGVSAVNLLGKDGSFSKDVSDLTLGWLNGGVTGCSASGGVQSFTASQAYGSIAHSITGWSEGDVVLARIVAKSVNNNVSLYLNDGTSQSGNVIPGDNAWHMVTALRTVATGATGLTLLIQDNNTSGWAQIQVKEATVINLTKDAVTEAWGVSIPYFESYACLTNPAFENRRYNLVRNGNAEEGTGYWNCAGNAVLSIVNGKFQITGSGGSYVYQRIRVKPNTDYFISANISGSTALYADDTTITIALKNGAGTFNSGTNYDVVVVMYNYNGSVGTFDSVMLVEGTTAPAEYKSCDRQVWVAEGQFASGDTFNEKDGAITGLRWKKHRNLFGKDITPIYVGDYAGFKVIQLSDARIPAGPQIPSDCLVKYDGKIMVYEGGSTWAADKFAYDGANANLYLSVSDTDSGWAEAILPNNDEAKVFLNGWKAIWNNGTRYIGWASVLDNSVPSSAIVSTASGVNAAGQNKLNVTDGTKFANGSFVYLKHDDGNVYGYGVSSVAGNQLTLGSNLSAAASNNNSIALTDNYGTVAQNLLNWCKANVAPGYEGYRLHYKLLNPEPITDVNTHIHGEIWSIVPGDNYIDVECGMVLGEVATVQSDATHARINNAYYRDTWLKNKVENPLTIYKNQVDNTSAWVSETYGYGNYGAYTLIANYDPNAIYTIDYQILKKLHAQAFGSLILQYSQDVFTAITGTAKATEAKQDRNSVLDTLVTTATYEECGATPNRYLNWCISGSTLFIEFFFEFKVEKEEVPAVSYSGLNLWVLDVNVVPFFTIHGFYITKKGVSVRFKTTDSATIASIKTNGIAGALAIKVTKKGA